MSSGKITRRQLMALAATSPTWAGSAPTRSSHAIDDAAASASPPADEFPLLEFTITQLQETMASGRYTASQILQLYLTRIEALDRRGPKLQQVLECNPDAPALAQRLDAERKAGHVRGPLHGIPILLKDNIGTADRMQTTAGSLSLLDARPPRDAFIVSRLRAAGAIILGKANMTEWATRRGTLTLNGWSARGGQGRNPYVLDRSPSGSSSGPAAGVAANYCAAAIGTETGGSIVTPSAANSVVGMRTTLGLLSRSTIIPVSSSLDVPGPIARTVEDVALVLGAMTGMDVRDSVTAASQGHAATNYSAYTKSTSLRGVRIGVTRAYLFGRHPGVDAVIEAAIEQMRRDGAILIDPADVAYDELEKATPELLAVAGYDYVTELPKYLADLPPGSPKSLADLIAFNERHADREMRYFGQEEWLALERSRPISVAQHATALRRLRFLARDRGIDLTMNQHRLDALIGPSAPPAGLIDPINGDTVSFASPAMLAAAAGYPHITVPAGRVGALPVGISFIGRAWSEPELLSIASAFERMARRRRPPEFLPGTSAC